jgi:predicted RNA-binding protein with RPS1 domain
MQVLFKNRMMLRLAYLLVVVMIAAGFSGCKSQKKIAARQAAAERLAAIEQAKQDLLMIINDQGDMSIAQKERKVADINAMNLNDDEVDALIIEAEKAIDKLKLEQKRLEEERLKKEREAAEARRLDEQKFSKIEDYFDAISAARTVDVANSRINEALKFFASPDVPVLIIVFMDGSIKDYDRPTTIRRYLEYLKDQSKNLNKVHNIQYDANGKITELELIKM